MTSAAQCSNREAHPQHQWIRAGTMVETCPGVSTQRQPRAWLDRNNVPCFRADVPLDEASELQDMLGAAFNAGVVSGYEQGVARLRDA